MSNIINYKQLAVLWIMLVPFILPTILAGPAEAQPFVWYIDDGPDSQPIGWWQDTTIHLTQRWEYMDPYTVLEGCIENDIPPPGEYWEPLYACTHPENADYSGYNFRAELWIVNGGAMTNQITVELQIGSPGMEGPVLASQTFVPEVGDECIQNTIDFGYITSCVLNNQSLILKIYRNTGSVWDMHICWDGNDCPSALHADWGTAPCYLNCPMVNCPLENSPGMVSQNKSPDIDGNGTVGLTDFAIFGSGYPSPPKPYNYCIDFDCNGLINVVDFSIFAMHWLHTGPDPGYCK
jgi:hypothetical protein